jgi:hypothetical protein
MTWTPRSIRGDSEAVASWEGPFTGVPSWLQTTLMGWVSQFFVVHRSGGIIRYNEESLRQIQMDLHLPLNWLPGAGGAMESLLAYANYDQESFLDIIDWCAWHHEPSELTLN